MNSFKNGSSSSDRVDPKLVTPSRHSVFIRGFPSNTSMENVRTFFKNETKENCKIDFFSYSEDRKKLFIALRFESHEKAVDVIENYDNKEVLGHSIEVSWFKDLRKARKQLIEEERATRNESRSPIEWNMMSRGQGGYNRSGLYMWQGRYLRNRGMRGLGNFGRQREFQRRIFNNRNTGCWRRARLSPGHPSRVRRERSHSNSRSYSQSGSRSRSRTRSYSSKSNRRSFSSFSSRKSREKSSSNKDVGHDSVHKYRMNKSQSPSQEKHDNKQSHAPSESASTGAVTGSALHVEPSSKTAESSLHVAPTETSSPPIVHAYSISPSESSASSNEVSCKMEKSSNKRHKRKSKKKNKKRKLIKKSKDSEDNSSGESADDQRCVKITDGQKEHEPVAAPSSEPDVVIIKATSPPKTAKDETGELCNIKSDFPNLTAEDHIKVLAKKESLEKAYKKDCETVASVSKLIISKNPSIEESILIILKSLFADIGDKYVEELRSYVTTLGEPLSKTLN